MYYVDVNGFPVRGRQPKPWYRASSRSWYVTLDGRQVSLGRTHQVAQANLDKLMKKLNRRADPIKIGTRPRIQFVYFVQEFETKHIKIGITFNPKTRLVSLQSGNPNELILLCAVKGFPGDEQCLHREFADLRIRGEWFRYDQRIIDAMNRFMKQDELS